LTVKIRLPETWAACNVVQDNVAVDCDVVEYDGSRYALVQAIPDRGTVLLTPLESNES
jgi:hypothetical protein